MPKHLRTIFKNNIKIQKLLSSRQEKKLFEEQDMSIQDVFHLSSIAAIDNFFECAEQAILFFQNEHERHKKPKIKRGEMIKDLITPCSFICISENTQDIEGIYAISREIVGFGSYGRVKIALRIDNPDTKIYTIKIQSIETKNGKSDLLMQKISSIKTEIALGFQQGFFSHRELSRYTGDVNKTTKYYAIAPHAGITLRQWLANCNPSEKERLEVAIKICQRVHKLHEDGYVHRDIKLSNILIDPFTLKITLIDFGFSVPVLEKDAKSDDCAGTLNYLPVCSKNPSSLKSVRQKMQLMTLIELDSFALKRVLAMPFNQLDRKHPFYTAIPSLLPEEAISSLGCYIDTDNENQDSLLKTPLSLMAYLILYQNRIPFPLIPLSLELQQSILAIHLDSSLNDIKIRLSRLTSCLSFLTFNDTDKVAPPHVGLHCLLENQEDYMSELRL